MDAKELRIGNYVIYNGDSNNPHLDCKIDGEDIAIMERDNEYLNEHTPIPITEEWLLGFGFLNGDNDFFPMFEKYPLFISIENCPIIQLLDEDHILIEGFELLHIKFVHQLQNLYFAITGEELTNKEEGK